MGSGPGIAVGAALALRDTGRLPIALMGDGDFIMGNAAVWTAAHSRVPVLMVVCNNRAFYNDQRHQERMAAQRGRPLENSWIGQHLTDPEHDIAGMARAQGAIGIGPFESPGHLLSAIRDGLSYVQAGGVVVIDLRVPLGYDNRG